jgi:hypothetical protein
VTAITEALTDARIVKIAAAKNSKFKSSAGEGTCVTVVGFTRFL